MANTPTPRKTAATTEEQLERMLNEYEVEEISGRSVGSLRRDRLFGKGIPYVKLGALVRYRPSDVRDYIEQNLHGGAR
jgi:hypothetical protein